MNFIVCSTMTSKHISIWCHANVQEGINVIILVSVDLVFMRFWLLIMGARTYEVKMWSWGAVAVLTSSNGGASSRRNSTSLSNQSPVFVRYAPRHASHPWLIPSLHLRCHAHSAPACTVVPRSDGSLMTCSLYTAINLFIGHLPASWRYVSVWVYMCESRTINITACSALQHVCMCTVVKGLQKVNVNVCVCINNSWKNSPLPHCKQKLIDIPS